MLLTSFFAVAMCRHKVLENAAITAVAARRWQAAGPQFPTMHPPSTFQWLLCKHDVRGGMQRQAVAKHNQPEVAVRGSGHGDRTALPRGHAACV